MPMTQAKAQELLNAYTEVLNSVNRCLEGFDTNNPNVNEFIPRLLNALELIADPRKASDPYFIKQAQEALIASVKEKEPMRSGHINPTTLEHLSNKYQAPALLTLQSDIRDGLIAELVVDAPSAIEGPAAIAPEAVVTTSEGEQESKDDSSAVSSITSEGGSESKDNVPATTLTKAVDEDNSEALVEKINWALWLKRGALTVCFVASLAACVVAAMTLNPVIGGVGVAATAITGFALAKSFGFFKSNFDDSEDDDSTLSLK